MLPRALSDDVYVFERAYMGHHCLVALNKGPAQRVTLTQLGLPDGSYESLVRSEDSPAAALVVVGGSAELWLPQDSALVYHHTPPVPPAKALVTVQVNGCRPRQGERLYVLGDCAELGSWDQDRARPLEFVNANTWSLDVSFDQSLGQTVRYKYLLKDERGRLVHENTLGHYGTVPSSGRAIWRDEWQAPR